MRRAIVDWLREAGDGEWLVTIALIIFGLIVVTFGAALVMMGVWGLLTALAAHHVFGVVLIAAVAFAIWWIVGLAREAMRDRDRDEVSR